VSRFISTGKVWTSTSAKAAAAAGSLENEPDEPVMRTEIPGPKSKQLIGDLSKLQVKHIKLQS
jgi:hypothetical protein